MNEYGMHGWNFGMGLGWLILLLIIAVLVYFIKNTKKEELSARDILDKRYANGEMDDNEYKTKRDALKK